MDQQETLRLKAGGETFTVPAALLDKYGRDWRDFSDVHPDYKHTGHDCKGCPHTITGVKDPCVIRAFLHWLYTGQIPVGSLVREMPFPEKWANGKETDVVGTSMALQLCEVSLWMDILDLQNNAITFIFGQYKAAGTFPDTVRVTDVCNVGWCCEQSLHILTLDLILKRCDGWTKRIEFPEFFFSSLLNRVRHLDKAGKSISRPLSLSDYHHDTPLHDGTCSCKKPDAGEEYPIK